MDDIKFYNYYVKNATTGKRCKIRYTLDNHSSGEPCVRIYAREYGNDLYDVLGEWCDVVDNTDSMTDYFTKAYTVLFVRHPLYVDARMRANLVYSRDQKREAKRLQSLNKEAETMKTKQPRIMNAVFPGKCSVCGKRINKGQSMRWIERGVIECVEHRETDNQTVTDAPQADAWGKALAWDTQTPETVSTPTTAPVNLTETQRDVVESRMAANNITQTAPLPAATPRPKLEPIDQLIDLPQLDVSTQLTLDMMVTTVNALNALELEQRQALTEHLDWLARNSESRVRRHAYGRMNSAAMY